jgi:hypothetical protein
MRAVLVLLAASLLTAGVARAETAPAEIEAIAREATIYGYPMVMNYKTIFAYAVDAKSPAYRAPMNRIFNEARVYTPQDTTIVTPNSDTPYSFLTADLRAEPLVLGVPAVEGGRYYSLQLIDLYTYNFAYAGTRTTGRGAAKFLLAGPGWNGTVPDGIAKVFRADTELALVVYRTQLFGPDDLENVKKVQAGYTALPLHAYAKTPAPPAAPVIDYPRFTQEHFDSLNFFSYLAFVLQLCPPMPDDAAARARFATIGIEPGKPFQPGSFSPAGMKALDAGKAAGLAAIDAATASAKSSGDLFGTRQEMQNDYLRRAAGAKGGIYGNSKEEAAYFRFTADAKGEPLDGSKHRYALRFAKDGLPPVSAFWSVTMYDGAKQLLVANPIDRYLVNSTMLDTLKRDADGGLTLHVQKDTPGPEREANWLPAPNGPIYMILRAYGPEEPVLDGKWTPPPVTRTD